MVWFSTFRFACCERRQTTSVMNAMKSFNAKTRNRRLDPCIHRSLVGGGRDDVQDGSRSRDDPKTQRAWARTRWRERLMGPGIVQVAFCMGIVPSPFSQSRRRERSSRKRQIKVQMDGWMDWSAAIVSPSR